MARRRKRRRSTFYGMYIRSDDWRAKRQDVFAVQGERCSLCGAVKRLQVHHLHYKTLGHEDPAKDLVVLCESCHKQEHGKREKRVRSSKGQINFGDITRDSYRNSIEDVFLDRGFDVVDEPMPEGRERRIKPPKRKAAPKKKRNYRPFVIGMGALTAVAASWWVLA